MPEQPAAHEASARAAGGKRAPLLIKGRRSIALHGFASSADARPSGQWADADEPNVKVPTAKFGGGPHKGVLRSVLLKSRPAFVPDSHPAGVPAADPGARKAIGGDAPKTRMPQIPMYLMRPQTPAQATAPSAMDRTPGGEEPAAPALAPTKIRPQASAKTLSAKGGTKGGAAD